MREILILCTWWGKGHYWEEDKVAPYPGRTIEPVQHLKNALPIAAIGAYIKGRGQDFTHCSPCFLNVKNIEENERGVPQFHIHFISKMKGITSYEFLNEIGEKSLFSSTSQEKILEVLDKFGIQLPAEWKMLLEEKIRPSWLDWVGLRFQEIRQPISNPEYEERVAEIFSALGFEVEQMGHKREGEYPDGIIYARDFAVVYDCKNRSNYFLDAKDKRAMIRYVNYSKRRIEEQRDINRVYFAFIAHSYTNVKHISDIEKETSTKGLLLTSEALVYLTFKKLSLGRSFLLADFEELISNQIITKDRIERIYPGEIGVK